MHMFCELAKNSTTFTLGALESLRRSMTEELQYLDLHVA